MRRRRWPSVCSREVESLRKNQADLIKRCARERGVEEYQILVAESPPSVGIDGSPRRQRRVSDEVSVASGVLSGSGKRETGEEEEAVYIDSASSNFRQVFKEN
jgi:hypothetical protein